MITSNKEDLINKQVGALRAPDARTAERYFGPEQGKAWVEPLRGQPSVRIRVRPQWANIIDFETRFPSALTG
jgi:hypothetical protein